MRVIVVGNGKVVYFLSRNFLSKGHQVVVISRDPAECRWLARHLRATVLCGDGSRAAMLSDAGADDAEAVLAATPHDEDNLVICQTAQLRFNVPMTLAVVSNPENETIFPQLGVQRVVSLTRIVSNLIEESTGVEEITSLMTVGGGAVHLTEMVLDESSPALEKPLAEVRLAKDCLVACVVRDGRAVIPHGGTTLAAGDRIVLVTLPESHGPAVKALTGER
ncbi:MAG: TrkA family potassium uptake protein [Rhodopirellula sp.]|nr:TrkA family potassium uptake protein [Rhodopirellula sp.]